MYHFTLTKDYIELNKLLKLLSLVENWAEAKEVISQWLVSVNHVVELRIRNKLIIGDTVQYDDQEIVVE